MNLNEQIDYILQELDNSVAKQQEFTSTAVEQNKRVFSLLNTNTKTLNTYCKYLNDVIN